MKQLSPKELAQSLGVSESSVKRWVDDGALVATRTAGGHRRIAMTEAVSFVRRSGLPLPRPDLIVGGERILAPLRSTAMDAVGDQFLALLEKDNASAARALLIALYVSGWTVAAICDGPMRFALERIGSLWLHDPAGIVIEHRASDTCIRVLSELRALFTPPTANAPVALGAAPSGDPYLIPSMMAAAVLADLGYRDHNLGPDAPIAVLSQAAEQYRPRIVWLAMSVAPSNERLPLAVDELAGQLARRGATLVVGGRGVPAIGATSEIVRVQSMAELAAFARGAHSVT